MGRVVEATGQGQANVSKHLKLLAEAGIVGRRKAGLQVFYAVADPLIEQVCELVCGSIVREVEGDVERGRKILKNWRGDEAGRPLAAAFRPAEIRK